MDFKTFLKDTFEKEELKKFCIKMGCRRNGIIPELVEELDDCFMNQELIDEGNSYLELFEGFVYALEFRVDDLKDICAWHELKEGGKKAELIKRIFDEINFPEGEKFQKTRNEDSSHKDEEITPSPLPSPSEKTMEDRFEKVTRIIEKEWLSQPGRTEEVYKRDLLLKLKYEGFEAKKPPIGPDLIISGNPEIAIELKKGAGAAILQRSMGKIQDHINNYRRVIVVFVQDPFKKVQDFKDKLEKNSGERYTNDNKGPVRVIVKAE